ncbi:5-formyltetrahydrofolate cyclo-ligase [Clostridium malenominatum]|uniref:5-formyltetrahydrofolate cyclo-ligase n=1 Tax=Clostridium malenominatum TaxID=1539 RepID=A0ABN1IUZ6_9CLOT
MESKKDLRNRVIKLRDSLSLEERKVYDEEIYKKVLESDYYKNAQTIFVFVSYKTEVDTHAIIKKALEDGKRIAVPKIKTKKEGILPVEIKDFNELSSGNYGILEPKEDNIINKEEIDLILSPGVAFDKNGGRLGYGGGFYDKFISSFIKKIPIVAIGYKLQLVDQVPMDEFDMRVSDIITNG